MWMARSSGRINMRPGPGQTPPAAQPPAGQPPAAADPAAKKEPRISLTGSAGAFMFLIKPDQTANFEELMGKVKEALGKSENPVRKQQLAGWKVFKAAEPSGANALYPRGEPGDHRRHA